MPPEDLSIQDTDYVLTPPGTPCPCGICMVIRSAIASVPHETAEQMVVELTRPFTSVAPPSKPDEPAAGLD